MEAVHSGLHSGGGRHRRLRQSGAPRRPARTDGTRSPRRTVHPSERPFRPGSASAIAVQTEFVRSEIHRRQNGPRWRQ